jgi:hypothetical protein
MVDIVGRQIVFFDMLHIAAGCMVPNDLRPFHKTSALSGCRAETVYGPCRALAIVEFDIASQTAALRHF